MPSTLARFDYSRFLPLGTPKNPCVFSFVENKEALHHLIVDACQTIRNYPDIFELMWRYMMASVKLRIEFHGGHFEH
jgi:hypothetical protein